MRFTFAIILAGALASSTAAARDVFVNNVGGDDHNDGTAPTSSVQGGGPCRTIARALRAAQRGDRIVLAATGEPYRESITLQSGRHSGNEYAPFMIVGDGAILDGSRPIPQDCWEHFRGDVFRFRPRLLSYQQLFLDGIPVQRRFIEQDGRVPELEPLEWCLFEREVYFHVEKDRLPQQYNLTIADEPAGVTLYDVRNVVISGLTVQGFQLDGINAHDNAFEVTIVGCTARGNGRSGISIGGASTVTIESCLVGNNGVAQVRTEGYSHTRIVNCDLLQNPAPKIVSDGGEVTVEDPVERE